MEGITILRAGVERLHARLDHTGETEKCTIIHPNAAYGWNTHSSGIVMYTVMRPAMAPMPKVTLLGRVSPVRVRLCTNCLRVVYVVKRTAELAPCRIICVFIVINCRLFLLVFPARVRHEA